MSLFKILLVAAFLFCSVDLSASTPDRERLDRIEQLVTRGNQFRLKGNFEAANQIRDELLATFPDDPAGNVFNLNTVITQLSWEESQRQYDLELLNDVRRTLAWCDHELEQQSDDKTAVARANYYCGVANFSLSYFNGIRGNFLQAGRRGTRSIDYLEAALAADPTLIRAKMYLGVAYYYADNLPAFIKMMSRILWFIPTGNSEKSLPYLEAVMNSDDEFRDVARYIYITLLLKGNDDQALSALTELQAMVEKYPENARFQLRLVSVLVDRKAYALTIERISNLLESEHARHLTDLNLSLLKIWRARAHLGLGELAEASRLQDEIDLSSAGNNPPPLWSISWYLLTQAQLADLNQQRQRAIKFYEQIIELDKKVFVSRNVLQAATTGLNQPFTL